MLGLLGVSERVVFGTRLVEGSGDKHRSERGASLSSTRTG